MKRNPIKKTCEYCGNIFFTNLYRAEKVRFCSLKCKLKGYVKPRTICPNCGEAFDARASKRTKKGRQIFCSKECKWQCARNNRPQKSCERCGKDFYFYPSQLRYGNPRFCSQSCAGNMKKWENERFTRVKTKTWSEIRQSILERDEYKCAKCGSETKLTVHHIKRWVFTKDDSPSNLITLCRSCHWSIEWNGVPCPTPRV